MSPQACKPNISSAGKRRRRQIGYGAAAVALATLGASWLLHWPWYVRGLVFVPAALSAAGLLQASHGTCIARAAEGTFEHEDFSTTKAPEEEVAASRLVARAIRRDVLLVGLVSAVVAAASALVVR